MKVYKVLQLIFVILISCTAEKVFDLEDNGIQKLEFKSLPTEVRNFIETNIDSLTLSNKDVYYSTNKSITFTYGRSGASDNWINEVNNYHHFFIDGVHYRLKGNRGFPFILHEGDLYFTELNFHKDGFDRRLYFKVKIHKDNYN